MSANITNQTKYNKDDIGMDVIVTSDEFFNGHGFLATVVEVGPASVTVDISDRKLGAEMAQVSVNEVTPFDELVSLL
jgi:hypothetical protein